MSDNSRLKSTWFNAGLNLRIKSNKTASSYTVKETQKLRLRTPKAAEDRAQSVADDTDDDTVSARMDLDEITAVTSVADSFDALGQEEEDEDEAAEQVEISKGPDLLKEGSDVIVIHPGSAHLRLGFGSSILPRTIPHMIARKLNNPKDLAPSDTTSMEPSLKYEVETYAEEVEALIKARMKAKKLRFIPNTRQLVHSFNEYSEAERIQDHNDPAKVEWILPEETDESPSVFVGHAAQLVVENQDSKLSYEAKYPVRRGKLNWKEYVSREALLSDLDCIWTYALEAELEIYKSDYAEFNILLVIPDTCDRRDMLLYIELLMKVMGFRSFSLMQESQCSTFGSGVLTACVVDVGAQQTSIACIEDGYLLPTTRFKLNFGGDDITRIMWELFQCYTEFPYTDFRLDRMADFLTMESLKEYYGTMKEEDITVQLCECHIRVPRQLTLKYKFKVFDDTMMATIAHFYPKTFMKHHSSERFLESYSPIYTSAVEKIAKRTGVTKGPKEHPLFSRPLEIVSEISNETGDKQDQEHEVIVENAIDMASTDAEMDVSSEDADQVLPLDNAIVLSIASTSQRLLKHMKNSKRTEDTPEMVTLTYTDEERIKKMFNSILFVGGGLAKFPGAPEFLRDQLFATFYHLLPLMFNIDLKASNFNLDNVNVLANARNLDPQVISWKGGAIACRLDTLVKDCWVSNAEWKWYGEVLLKDRVLFEWQPE